VKACCDIVKRGAILAALAALMIHLGQMVADASVADVSVDEGASKDICAFVRVHAHQKETLNLRLFSLVAGTMNGCSAHFHN
jgi:hypothetical protein